MLRLLLVEDNPADVDIVQEALNEHEGAGFELTAVSCVADALAALTGRRVDAVLLDLSLPDATGLEAFARLYAAAPGVPIIVLSGNADEVTALRAVREGAQDYLLKGQLYPTLLVRAIHYGIERKRSHDTVQALEEQVRQGMAAQLRQSQVESIGQLAGGIAHDFNNLLTAIRGHAEAALAELERGKPVQEDLFAIVEASDRAARLTRQILAYGRKQVLHARTLNLNEVIESVSKLLRRVIGEDIQLVTRLDPHPDTVKADPSQLEQVIVNLAVNARDAMRGGGRLELETRNVSLEAALAPDFGEPVVPGRYVMLAVSDTGHGVPADIRDRIFEPYFSTKHPTQGTGLGLSTVYGIVKQSNGYIWVYSEPGEGATFKIYLPSVQAEPEEPAIPERSQPAERLGWQTVLLVEDEPFVRRLAARVLQWNGYRVLTAGNGPEAINIAAAEAGAIHLLLTDMVMPGMGGRELAEELAAGRPEMRVLFTSGYTEDEIIRRGRASAGIQFLEKPFSPATLIRKVAEILGS